MVSYMINKESGVNLECSNCLVISDVDELEISANNKVQCPVCHIWQDYERADDA